MADKSQTITHGGISWENITHPTHKTVDYLSKKHKFHHLDLEDCLSKIQRPKIDEYEKYMFIVLHFPYYDKATDSIRVDEINIFIGQTYLITLSKGHKVLNKIFDEAKRRITVKRKYMGSTSGYLLYHIIDEMFGACFPLVDNLEAEIDEIEDAVFETENPKDMLKDILSFKKDIITFRRIIIPQRTLVAQLEHKNKKFLPEDLDVYFDDVVDKVEKIYSNLETLRDIVTSLQETNESILTHNTNNIIKILTIFSVVMLPLTFITGLYGMNIIGLPFAEHQFSFGFVAGFLIMIVLVMLVFFRYKKWI
jgi:magnesium transporter